MRKNILPKLAVEKRKEVPKHFFIFVVIVVSVVSVAVFFIVPHPMVSTPTIPIGFPSFFFYRMHCVSFHNCKGKSFRPAMEMSLSANKETDQSLKEKRKSTMKESCFSFLVISMSGEYNVRKGGIFQGIEEKERGEGEVGEWQKFRPSSRYHASRQIAVRTIPYLTKHNTTTVLNCNFGILLLVIILIMLISLPLLDSVLLQVLKHCMFQVCRIMTAFFAFLRL